LLDKDQQEKYISDLKKLDIPFLLLQGSEDVLVAMQGTIELDSYLKNSKLIKYEGFDHTIPAIVKKQGRQIMLDMADLIRNS
jgi:pimeloyl-ACP methyl ester carboxylesterase